MELVKSLLLLLGADSWLGGPQGERMMGRHQEEELGRRQTGRAFSLTYTPDGPSALVLSAPSLYAVALAA